MCSGFMQSVLRSPVGKVRGIPALKAFDRKRRSPINKSVFGGTPPQLDCDHPVDMSRLSRRNVPFVPRTFCPLCVDWHRNQARTSYMSLELPSKPFTGHFQSIPTTKFLYVFLVYAFSTFNKGARFPLICFRTAEANLVDPSAPVGQNR